MSADRKMSRELAEKEVYQWIHSKKVKQKKIEGNADSIETLIDAFSEGNLSLNPESNVLTLKLSFPAGNINSLDFKPRLKVSETHKRLKSVKASDIDGRVLAYVSALTDQSSGIVGDLDTEDYSICQAIAVFFF